MRRAQSSGLPIGRQRPASAAAQPTAEVLNGAGRRLKSAIKENGSRDRPTSASVFQGGSGSGSGDGLDVAPRARSGSEHAGGRWNPFKRTPTAAAPAAPAALSPAGTALLLRASGA